MKLDYKFIKEILLTIENQYSHEMRNYDLMKALNVISSNDADGKVNNDLIEKYVGHIKILWEDSILKSSSDNHGFSRITGGGYQIADPRYSITKSGYEFLEMLKNDTILNKIKDFSINNALLIGRELLIKLAVSKLGM